MKVKLKPVFEVAIPDSFTSNYRDLTQRTLAVGFVARACAIFQVERIYIYREEPRSPRVGISRQIKKILEYLDTPQYLRRALFKINRDLKCIGVAPPLKAPHHKPWKPIDKLRIGEVRDGVVVKNIGERSLIYVGLDRNVVVRERFPKRKKVTVRIHAIRGEDIMGEVVNREVLKEYWGYRVEVLSHGLEPLLREKRDHLKILTSRMGEPVYLKLLDLKNAVKSCERVLIVFGGPYRGLFEILGEKLVYDLGDLILNMIPYQATETVRTEEAIFITLGILNLVRAW